MKLYKLKHREDALYPLDKDTAVLEGECFHGETSMAPKVGHVFYMKMNNNPNCGEGDILKTSTVEKILNESGNAIVFETKNSVYRLEF